MNDAELVRWAITTIRELDEVGRSMIAGFEPMNSEEMGYLADLRVLAKKLDDDCGCGEDDDAG